MQLKYYLQFNSYCAGNENDWEYKSKLQLILWFSLERSALLRATVANWLCSKSAFFTSWVVRISVTKQSLQLFSLRGRIRLPRRKYMPAVEFLSLTMMDCIKVNGSWYVVPGLQTTKTRGIKRIACADDKPYLATLIPYILSVLLYL